MSRKLFFTMVFLLLSFSSVNAQTCDQCHSDVVNPYQAGPHAALDCNRCHQNGNAHAANPQTPTGVRVEVANCGECHQLQFDSYMEGEGTDQTPQKQDEYPILRRLLAGHPFAEDYREPRSHVNMLTDFVRTSRPRSATCMLCKSSDVYWQWNNNINYDSNTGELLDQNIIVNPITCVQCHNPHVPELRVVQPALIEATERMPQTHPGKEDPMGTRVCSQCHVNYNLNPPAKGIEFPFVKVAEMPDYIVNTDIWRQTKTGGWDNPEAGTMLYKVQHPEAELYWDSIHHKLGVSCADCHMPKRTAANGQTYTQHWLTSPLNHIEDACLVCHTQSAGELQARVKGIQDEVYALIETAMNTMDEALDNLVVAQNTATVNENRLNDARENYFMAHLFWEWIAAENSMGFHNAAEARESLTRATAFASDAIDQAAQSVGNMPLPEEPPSRRIPWIPILLGLAVTIGAIAYIIRRRR
ncbi:MAG: ammonia-forming cytochrome c nitrite reductase subunit c552 [Clostridiales bacterium]|nr:ammonia-forming cytochrome c nitrite reductase subunit c552 [Clostridiales bacterium]